MLTPLKTAGKPSAAVMSLKQMDVGRRRCRDELQGSGSMCHWEGLAGEDLAAPLRYRRGTKMGSRKRCELEKSAGTRTAYRSSALIISRLGNTASSAGWSTVLLGHLLQVKPGGQGRCTEEGGAMWLMASPMASAPGGPCTSPREDLIFSLKKNFLTFFSSVCGPSRFCQCTGNCSANRAMLMFLQFGEREVFSWESGC